MSEAFLQGVDGFYPGTLAQVVIRHLEGDTAPSQRLPKNKPKENVIGRMKLRHNHVIQIVATGVELFGLRLEGIDVFQEAYLSRDYLKEVWRTPSQTASGSVFAA